MKEQPHYLELLTKEFFEKYYLEQKMSFPKIVEMLSEQGYNIAVGTIYKYYKKLGLKSGLEIHQQLNTNKLFCNCPSILSTDEPKYTIERKLIR